MFGPKICSTTGTQQTTKPQKRTTLFLHTLPLHSFLHPEPLNARHTLETSRSRNSKQHSRTAKSSLCALCKEAEAIVDQKDTTTGITVTTGPSDQGNSKHNAPGRAEQGAMAITKPPPRPNAKHRAYEQEPTSIYIQSSGTFTATHEARQGGRSWKTVEGRAENETV